jgi:hypothetical protein
MTLSSHIISRICIRLCLVPRNHPPDAEGGSPSALLPGLSLSLSLSREQYRLRKRVAPLSRTLELAAGREARRWRRDARPPAVAQDRVITSTTHVCPHVQSIRTTADCR